MRRLEDDQSLRLRLAECVDNRPDYRVSRDATTPQLRWVDDGRTGKPRSPPLQHAVRVNPERPSFRFEQVVEAGRDLVETREPDEIQRDHLAEVHPGKTVAAALVRENATPDEDVDGIEEIARRFKRTREGGIGLIEFANSDVFASGGEELLAAALGGDRRRKERQPGGKKDVTRHSTSIYP